MSSALLRTSLCAGPNGERSCLAASWAPGGAQERVSVRRGAHTQIGARRTRKLDGLRCRRGGRQGVFEGQTSDGDEPGDPSPLPRLPHSGRNRAAPGGLITSDRNLVRARRDYRLFERSLDGHACSWGCAFTGVAGVQRRGRPAPWSSFGRSSKAAPHRVPQRWVARRIARVVPIATLASPEVLMRRAGAR